MADPTYDPATDPGRVRLLLNDIPAGAPPVAVFSDAEIQAFLDLEGGSVKKAAAQAIDTNATNLVLAMRVHADRLRQQAVQDDEDGDGFYFDVVDLVDGTNPELTEYWQP